MSSGVQGRFPNEGNYFKGIRSIGRWESICAENGIHATLIELKAQHVQKTAERWEWVGVECVEREEPDHEELWAFSW